jgi:hypothetical protein
MKKVTWKGPNPTQVGGVPFQPGDSWYFWRQENIPTAILEDGQFDVNEVSDDDARGVIGRFYQVPPPGM